MRRYSGDPYWLMLRYRAICAGCGREIKRGERAFRFKDGSLYCDSDGCGRRESAAFNAAAQDEETLSSGGAR
jgi:hypothetical protein